MNAILGAVGSLLGVVLFMKVQGCTGISGKAMIVIQLCIFSLLSVMGAAGVISKYPTYGFYAVMAPALLMIGAIQSYTRSLFASFVPKGRESAMFAFFAITDKGSNVFGAGVIAWVNNMTGKYTGVFFYLAPAFLLSAILVGCVDVEQGVIEAGMASAEDEEGSSRECSEDQE
eukprot:TRINITY_DN114738_c0_g1_i1.p1 TRINITY_DN114738_c0_g1~~TRINITY_DN114738_c0_g1_i1.p1  ORF type:complete len:173 (-),score=27.35 TRINITY_DN114738_c0_g1_i1:59-577(-)